jgi:ATP-dependent DNA helicase RecG
VQIIGKIINIKIVEFAKSRKHLTITFMDDTGQMELGVIQEKAMAS